MKKDTFMLPPHHLFITDAELPQQGNVLSRLPLKEALRRGTVQR